MILSLCLHTSNKNTTLFKDQVVQVAAVHPIVKDPTNIQKQDVDIIRVLEAEVETKPQRITEDEAVLEIEISEDRIVHADLDLPLRIVPRGEVDPPPEINQEVVDPGVVRNNQIVLQNSLLRCPRDSKPSQLKVICSLILIIFDINYYFLSDDCIGVSRFKESVLDEINADSFTPKTFTSQKENKLKNIIIDITTDTIQIPSISDTSSNLLDSVFHSTVRFKDFFSRAFAQSNSLFLDYTRSGSKIR